MKITPDLQSQSLSSSAHTTDAWRCWWIMCDNLSRSHSSLGCYVPFGSNCWTRTVNNNNNGCKQAEATPGILKDPETPEGSSCRGTWLLPQRQGTLSWGHSCPTVEWRRRGQRAIKIWNHGQVLLNAGLNLTPVSFRLSPCTRSKPTNRHTNDPQEGGEGVICMWLQLIYIEQLSKTINNNTAIQN